VPRKELWSIGFEKKLERLVTAYMTKHKTELAVQGIVNPTQLLRVVLIQKIAQTDPDLVGEYAEEGQ